MGREARVYYNDFSVADHLGSMDRRSESAAPWGVLIRTFPRDLLLRAGSGSSAPWRPPAVTDGRGDLLGMETGYENTGAARIDPWPIRWSLAPRSPHKPTRRRLGARLEDAAGPVTATAPFFRAVQRYVLRMAVGQVVHTPSRGLNAGRTGFLNRTLPGIPPEYFRPRMAGLK